MKISGFTFIKNAVKYDFPIVEAITSILPLCDEVIVLVGDGEDTTEDLIKSIGSDKIKIHHSVWDETLREGGVVLAKETDKALDLVSDDSDWAFYIQGDEVFHEKYNNVVKTAMQTHLHNPKVEGLLFNYRHFYGSYQYYGDSRNWYRREIRVIRNDKKIRAYRDAQGFRKNGEKLHVKHIPAYIFHYGWVKDPINQIEKIKNSTRFWKDDQFIEKKYGEVAEFNYLKKIDSLVEFTDTHPQVMQNRVDNQDWEFTFDPQMIQLSLKEKLSRWVEKTTGWRPGEYQNYRII